MYWLLFRGMYKSLLKMTKIYFVDNHLRQEKLCLYFSSRKRGSLMDIDFKEELRERDEPLAGYLMSG